MRLGAMIILDHLLLEEMAMSYVQIINLLMIKEDAHHGEKSLAMVSLNKMTRIMLSNMND
jgi:hypothetical protein